MNVLLKCFPWLLFAMTGHALAAPIGHWCKPDERLVFACHAGTKTVSLCARGDLAGPGGALAYRFGKLNAPVELEVGAAGAAMKKMFSYENAISAAGFSRLIRFKRGSINYVVNHLALHYPDKPADNVVGAILVVLMPDKVVRIECDEPSAIDNMPAEMDGKGFPKW